MHKVNCIMLVDDSPADNTFHELIIKKSGLCNRIIVSMDGDQALKHIIKASERSISEEFPAPDLIFLDINMPKINGFEFIEACQKLDIRQKPKGVIVMLTTSLNPADKARAEEFKEIEEFRNKPLTVAMLNELVEKYF